MFITFQSQFKRVHVAGSSVSGLFQRIQKHIIKESQKETEKLNIEIPLISDTTEVYDLKIIKKCDS